jgi:predicted GIY-YIG superfamily endonuclease
VADYENVCYLIHFERPINKSGTQHYIGFALHLNERIAKHRASKGAQILRRANALGIRWEVVRVWRNGSREAELGLKQFGGKNLCPRCSKFRKVSARPREARLFSLVR